MAIKTVNQKTTAAALQRIKKTEEVKYDVYRGAAADLIAAGILREDQLPPKGKGISYLQGKVVRGNHRYDETFLRIWHWVDGITCVEVGVPMEVARARKAARDAQYAAARGAAQAREGERRERALCAEEARQAGKRLAEMPKTHAAYRGDRAHLMEAFLKTLVQIPDPCKNHGYSYDDEARAEMAELAERMLNLMKTGNTVFNAKRHASIVLAHKATIARGDSKFVGMLAALAVAHEAGEEVDHG